MSLIDKAKKGAASAAAAAALVNITIDQEHNEVARVTFAGIPLFKRDAEGRPRVLGIPFKRRKPRA